MKKIAMIAGAFAFFTACDSAERTETTIENADSATNSAVVTEQTTRTYSPADGDVTYRGGKVMVYRNNDWVEADEDVTLEGGVVVKRNGEVVRDGKTVKLEEGESIDRSGNFWNSVGDAIEDGWDATKEGAKDAGQAIKKGAQEVGGAIESAVD